MRKHAKKRRNLLTCLACAEMLGIDRRTLYNWQQQNKGPPRIRIGKRFLYSEEMVAQWLKAMSVAS